MVHIYHVGVKWDLACGPTFVVNLILILQKALTHLFRILEPLRIGCWGARDLVLKEHRPSYLLSLKALGTLRCQVKHWNTSTVPKFSRSCSPLQGSFKGIIGLPCKGHVGLCWQYVGLWVFLKGLLVWSSSPYDATVNHLHKRGQ